MFVWRRLIHKNYVLESQTIDDFARALSLTAHDVRNLKMIFNSVEQGDFGILSAIGIKVTNGYKLLGYHVGFAN